MILLDTLPLPLLIFSDDIILKGKISFVLAFFSYFSFQHLNSMYNCYYAQYFAQHLLNLLQPYNNNDTNCYDQVLCLHCEAQLVKLMDCISALLFH